MASRALMPVKPIPFLLGESVSQDLFPHLQILQLIILSASQEYCQDEGLGQIQISRTLLISRGGEGSSKFSGVAELSVPSLGNKALETAKE